MVIPIHVEQYLLSESARQSASPEPMIKAYLIANEYDGPLSERFILNLANRFGFDWYRRIPVTFASGGHSTNYHLIPEAMTRLIEHAPPTKLHVPPTTIYFSEWKSWIKAFLQIHPFQDGNGRVASLLFNWGMNTLDEPFPLPYYKF